MKNLSSIKIDNKDIHIIKNSNLTDWQREVKQYAKEELLSERELRLRDITWKLNNRGSLKTFLMMLLVYQNVAVFALVVISLLLNRMTGLQLIFSTLVGGTLLETASAIYVMTRWLFSDIKYDRQSIHEGK